MNTSITAVRDQQTDFVSQALTDLFHTSPEEFLFLLNRDGTKFLRFYWDQVGKRLPSSQLVTAFGLNYDIRKPRKDTAVALITLPKPKREPEAYFVALVHRPSRVTPIFRISDTTMVVALEYKMDAMGNDGTQLVEWTRRFERELLNVSPEPTLDAFYEAIVQQIEE
jgi:hypothetical protein